MYVIQYAHLRNENLYTGTVSDLDNALRSTWTYQQGHRKVTVDQPIDLKTFDLLCKGTKDYKVFQRNLARDSRTRLDPSAFHIVTFIVIQNGREQTQTFLIPAGESDQEFSKWLKALNVPVGE